MSVANEYPMQIRQFLGALPFRTDLLVSKATWKDLEAWLKDHEAFRHRIEKNIRELYDTTIPADTQMAITAIEDIPHVRAIALLDRITPILLADAIACWQNIGIRQDVHPTPIHAGNLDKELIRAMVEWPKNKQTLAGHRDRGIDVIFDSNPTSTPTNTTNIVDEMKHTLKLLAQCIKKTHWNHFCTNVLSVILQIQYIVKSGMTLTNIDKEKELMEGLSPSEHSALIGHATSRSLVVPLASVLLWGGLALYSNRNLAVKSPNKTKHLLLSIALGNTRPPAIAAHEADIIAILMGTAFQHDGMSIQNCMARLLASIDGVMEHKDFFRYLEWRDPTIKDDGSSEEDDPDYDSVMNVDRGCQSPGEDRNQGKGKETGEGAPSDSGGSDVENKQAEDVQDIRTNGKGVGHHDEDGDVQMDDGEDRQGLIGVKRKQRASSAGASQYHTRTRGTRAKSPPKQAGSTRDKTSRQTRPQVPANQRAKPVGASTTRSHKKRQSLPNRPRHPAPDTQERVWIKAPVHPGWTVKQKRDFWLNPAGVTAASVLPTLPPTPPTGDNEGKRRLSTKELDAENGKVLLSIPGYEKGVYVQDQATATLVGNILKVAQILPTHDLELFRRNDHQENTDTFVVPGYSTHSLLKFNLRGFSTLTDDPTLQFQVLDADIRGKGDRDVGMDGGEDEYDPEKDRYLATAQDMITIHGQPATTAKLVNALNFPMHVPHDLSEPTRNKAEYHAWIATRQLFRITSPYPWSVETWGIAATAGTYHRWHVDSNGLWTHVDVKCGVKLWITGKPKDGANNVIKQMGEEEVNENLMDLKYAILKPGDRLVMPPGTPHLVVTLESSICHGGHFYTLSGFRKTFIAVINSQLQSTFVTNTHYDAATVMLLRMVGWMYLWFVEGEQDDANHLVPDVTTPEGLIDLAYLLLYPEIVNLIDPRTYTLTFGNNRVAANVQTDAVNNIPAQDRHAMILARGLSRAVCMFLDCRLEITRSGSPITFTTLHEEWRAALFSDLLEFVKNNPKVLITRKSFGEVLGAYGKPGNKTVDGVDSCLVVTLDKCTILQNPHFDPKYGRFFTL